MRAALVATGPGGHDHKGYRMSVLRPAEIQCQAVVEIVTDYLEGDLSGRDRHRFEHHLLGCVGCTGYLTQIRVTSRLTGHLVPRDLSLELLSEFSEIYRRWQSL